MAFKTKIHYNKTLQFNECVCNPFNADFDGDEMNIHVLQNRMATAEAYEILFSTKNLLNIWEGNLNISFIQDFLTFSFLITSKDTFFTKE